MAVSARPLDCLAPRRPSMAEHRAVEVVWGLGSLGFGGSLLDVSGL